MYIDIAIIMDKDDILEDKDTLNNYINELLLEDDAEIHGVDFYNEDAKLYPLDSDEGLKIFNQFLQNTIDEFKDNFSKLFKRFLEVGIDKAYYDDDIHHHINTLSAGHILTYNIYYVNGSLVPITTKEEVDDILSNRDEYYIVVCSVHY